MAQDKYTQFTFKADFANTESLSGDALLKLKQRTDAFVKIAKSIDVEGLGTVVSQLEKTAEGFQQYISISKEMAPIFEKAARSYEMKQRTSASGEVQELGDYMRSGGVYMKMKGGEADTADFGTKHLRREILFKGQEMASFRKEIATKYSGIVSETDKKGVYDIAVPDMNVINEKGRSSPISRVIGNSITSLNRPYREVAKEKEEKRKENEEKQKKKESSLAAVKTLGVIMLAVKALQAIFAFLGKIYNAMGQMASKNAETAVKSFGLRVSAGDLRLREQGAQARGIVEGAYTGALSTIQQKYGNIQNVDKSDKTTEALATMLGFDVADFITMGLSGKKPDELLDMLMGGMMENVLAGKTTLQTTAAGTTTRERQENAFADHLTLIQSALGEDVATIFEKLMYDAMKSSEASVRQNAQAMSLSEYLEHTGLAVESGGIKDAEIRFLETVSNSFAEMKKIWDGIKDGLLFELARHTADLVQSFRKGIRTFMDPEAAAQDVLNTIEYNEAERARMEATKLAVQDYRTLEMQKAMEETQAGGIMGKAFGGIMQPEARAKAIHAAAKTIGQSKGKELPEIFQGLSPDEMVDLYMALLPLSQSYMVDDIADNYIKKVDKAMADPRDPKRVATSATDAIDLGLRDWVQFKEQDKLSPHYFYREATPFEIMSSAAIHGRGESVYSADAEVRKTLRDLMNTDTFDAAAELVRAANEARKDQKVEVFGSAEAVIILQNEKGDVLGRATQELPLLGSTTTPSPTRQEMLQRGRATQ